MADRYSVSVRWSDEDECYVATVPEIERLSALGDTVAEALAELEVAKELFLEAMTEKGVQLPEPRIVNTYSGQVRLRMPKSLHRSLTEEAAEEEVSLNTLMVQLLSERCERKRLEIAFQKATASEGAAKSVQVLVGESGSTAINISNCIGNVVPFPQRTSTVEAKRKQL